MKKIVAVIAIVCAAFVGCGATQGSTAQASVENDRFLIVHSEGVSSYNVFVDKETRVMYLYVRSGYSGGLSVMVDTQGNSLIWEDEK